MPRKVEKTTEKQPREAKVQLDSFRKKCYICKRWIELGEECYMTGMPMPIHRHLTCARMPHYDRRIL